MSTYDKASLVLIPSGSKTSKIYSQKPTNGDGDFSFSRSTMATRVNESGLIEKETQNLLLQSNQFDTTWYGGGTSVTSGQSGYDGSNDAWLFERTSAYNNLSNNNSQSGVQTFSVFAKAGSYDWIYLRYQNASPVSYRGAYFDLNNGVVGTINSDVISAEIESVGNGFYRCSITFNATIARVLIYPVDSNLGEANSGTGNIYIQDAQLEQGLVARDYIETTTSAVYGGITDNVPRIDYTDASCPSLLLEPTRTNTITASEYFDGGSLNNTTISADYNTTDTLSPEGVYNAAKLTATGSFPRYSYFPTIGDNVNVTISCFAKAGTANKFAITGYNKNTETASVFFNLSTGVAAFASYDELQPAFDIEDYGNGWYRCWISYSSGSGATAFGIRPFNHAQGETGGWTGSNYIYAYGAQMEQDASYPTSYIPTYGTSVTRNIDVCDVSNVSDVPTSYPFVINIEAYHTLNITNGAIGFYDNSNQYYYYAIQFLDNKVLAVSRPQGTTQNNLLSSSTYTEGFHKIAVLYENDTTMKLYVNGQLQGTKTDCVNNSFNTAFSDYIIGVIRSINTNPCSIKNVKIFNTELTNEELQNLTTI